MLHSTVLSPIFSHLPAFAALSGVSAVVKSLSSSGFKDWLREMRVIRGGLRKLDPTLYRCFHDLYLPRPDGNGSTQIDHVVVSPFGIFVIETKNSKGWIFGSEGHPKWSQQIDHRKSTFQNPLRQNLLHVRALMNLLGLPENRFHPVVVFIGDCEFKTPMPSNVLNQGLLPWMKNHETPILGPAALQRALSCLDELKRTTNRKEAARSHLQALKAGKVG